MIILIDTITHQEEVNIHVLVGEKVVIGEVGVEVARINPIPPQANYEGPSNHYPRGIYGTPRGQSVHKQ